MPPSKYARKSKCRTPIKFYIAPEGTVTEIEYFGNLQIKMRLENVEIILIEKNENDTCSDPEHSVEVASRYCKTHKLRPSKFIKVSIVTDFDRWRDKIAKAYEAAKQRHYDFYLSNPCIELWFLLHDNDLSQRNPDDLSPCRKCKKLFGNPNKIQTLYSKLEQAIVNAKKMDRQPNTPWPQEVGSNLYKLFELILMKC